MACSTSAQSADICFVVWAFDSVRHAPLGASTLIAACRARGFSVSAVYDSLLLGARIGFDLYDSISSMLPTRQPGEYLFKPFAYPRPSRSRQARSPR